MDPVIVRKAEHADRIARTPAELVAFQHDGWSAAPATPPAEAEASLVIPASHDLLAVTPDDEFDL